MRHYFILIFLFSFQHALFGQGSIKGKLIDSVSKTPLGLATITIFRADDTTLITYRLSTPDGDFRVTGMPLKVPCRIIISYSGYEPYRKDIQLATNTAYDLGIISLSPSSKSLEDILVIAERPPVTVKKDTIEFNASSFKTLPTALVEDLLKKLPGIQVDADGNITANGKRVNRILIDGKTFFGDDPKIASRNLPANVIDKVQLTEDKDEALRNSDGDLTNIGQVINLTLKKGVKKGWFGKLYAGGGTNSRYEAGGIANLYRDTLQLSLLAFTNNINRTAFSLQEVSSLGGFGRSGYNLLSVNNTKNAQNFSINGISFGGSDAGISRTSGAGFNLNHAPTRNKSFFLQYFSGGVKNNVQFLNNTLQFIGDTTLTTRVSNLSQRTSTTNAVVGGFNLKPDSLTSIRFSANYYYSPSHEHINKNIASASNKLGPISEGTGEQMIIQQVTNYNHFLFGTKQFKSKKGRTLSFINLTAYNNNFQQSTSDWLNNYFMPAPAQIPFNQLRKEESPTLSVQTFLNITEPLTPKWTLRYNNRFQQLTDKQDINSYDKDAASGKYDRINNQLSGGFTRNQNVALSSLVFNYRYKKLSFLAGINGLWQHINTHYKNITQQQKMSLFNIVPNLSFTYNQLSMSFSKNISAPAASYLMPVADSTNPFYIRNGNPNLVPAKINSFYLSNYHSILQKGITYNYYASGSFVNSDVILNRVVSINGTQSVTPVNSNGTVRVNIGGSFSKEYKGRQNFALTLKVSPGFNLDKRKLIVNNAISKATTISYGPGFSIFLNWNDMVELQPSYNPGISETRYTNRFFKNIRAITQYAETQLIIRWPKKLVWESNVAYRYNSELAAGMPRSNTLWNAAVTVLLFKGETGLLKLSTFDILGNNNGLTRYTTQNQLVDQSTNVLKSFTELSFTYNIRNSIAPKKVGGKERLFHF